MSNINGVNHIPADTGFGRADAATVIWLRGLAGQRGEWRDPLRPEVLVVPDMEGEAYVYDEKTGDYGEWAEGDAHAEAHLGHLAAAVSRYFLDTHPAFARTRDAIWEALEPRLEDVIDLDLNVPAQSEQFAALVCEVARAVVKANAS